MTGILTYFTKIYCNLAILKQTRENMVKPVLIVAGAIPVIFAILIAVPLVTKPEIPTSAVVPEDEIKIEYTNKDIRYTQKSEKEFYAIVMDDPGKEVVLKTLSTDIGALNSKILNIELLGSDEEISWERDHRGVVIKAPKALPTKYAHCFKITLEGYTENAIGGAVDAHKD